MYRVLVLVERAVLKTKPDVTANIIFAKVIAMKAISSASSSFPQKTT